MKVIYLNKYRNFNSLNKSIALGFFDGFHKGHIAVLNDALEYAKENNIVSTLITFNMSFKDYFRKGLSKDLYTIDDKIDKASHIGFDEIVIIELTDEFLKLDKDEFIEIFLKEASHISAGFDYTFGFKANGNSEYLKEIFKDKVSVIECLTYNEHKIGSSLIKEELDNGEIELVNELLYEPYQIHGTIYSKNNKIYMNSDNYIPRSGSYNVILDNMEAIIKIKYKKDINSLLIKILSDCDIDFNAHNHKIRFISYLNK